jgi:hypothetical protein
MDGKDIEGKSEDQMVMPKPGKFVAMYAESKALGEVILYSMYSSTYVLS